eukprot:87888-Chlamydomonas_euryale.AAC.1
MHAVGMPTVWHATHACCGHADGVARNPCMRARDRAQCAHGAQAWATACVPQKEQPDQETMARRASAVATGR